MKVWLAWHDDYEQSYVKGIFTNEADAAELAGTDGHVEEHEVKDERAATWTYWTRGADVYPDGVVIDWTREDVGRGEVTIAPVDDHLNQRDEPWDGHTQSHCGEHVCIHGTDREAVERAYEAAVARALARQDGKCHSPYAKHDGDIDGEHVYEAGFLMVRLRNHREPFKMACYRHFEHAFEETRPGVKICSRCCTAEYTFSSAVEIRDTGR